MKHRILAVTIVALVPGALGAQATATAQAQAQSEATAQTTAQAQAKTPRARIDAALSTAAEARIPVSLLKSKVAEGEAKHVSEERIAGAVEARHRTLLRASSTLARADV